MSEPWPGERARTGGVDRVPLPESAGVNGSLWLCGKHYVGPDPERALATTGATTIVCLNEADELAGRYPQYVEWLQANAGTRAVWFPVPDLHAPTVDEATGLVAELRRRLEAGEGLLVHCGAGIGRAGTVAAALLVEVGLSLDEALFIVAEHRPMAGPESGAQTDLLGALIRSRSGGR